VKTQRSTEKPPLPISPNELFRRLKELLGSYRDLKKITGIEISTLESWCISAPLDQVRTLLRLLSAIPDSERHSLVDSATLSLPRLDHRFLTGDQMTSAALRRIARKETGMTIVESESDYLRTFLATAIANSAVKHKLAVYGYDVHRPDWFAPVEGVNYLSIAENHSRIRETAQLKLNAPAGSHVVFLNGLWAHMEEQRRSEILRFTENYHLILCDRHRGFPRGSAIDNCHVITATRNPALPIGADDAQQMRITIEELK
jgi:hypothetical protein